MDPGREDVTVLLVELTKGNKTAASKLIPLVYSEMRRLAGGYMRRDEATIRCRPQPWYTRPI